MENKHDVISSPKHYQGAHGMEVRDVQRNFVPHYQRYGGMVASDAGNVIKYILRAPLKNGVEDLKKARKYLNWMIEEVKDYEED